MRQNGHKYAYCKLVVFDNWRILSILENVVWYIDWSCWTACCTFYYYFVIYLFGCCHFYNVYSCFQSAYLTFCIELFNLGRWYYLTQCVNYNFTAISLTSLSTPGLICLAMIKETDDLLQILMIFSFFSSQSKVHCHWTFGQIRHYLLKRLLL